MGIDIQDIKIGANEIAVASEPGEPQPPPQQLLESDLAYIKTDIYNFVREKYQWRLDLYDHVMTEIFNGGDEDGIKPFSKLKLKYIRIIDVETTMLFLSFYQACVEARLKPGMKEITKAALANFIAVHKYAHENCLKI